jgi:hypothetical protein
MSNMKTLTLTIKFIWELPQNILGIIVWLLLKNKVSIFEKNHNRFFFHVPNFGVSLGSFIFWSNSDSAIIEIKQNNKEHEYGHSIQSMIFGPLYLILVGVPSILRVLYGSIFYLIHKEKWKNYYSSYPENWADNLGEKYFCK